MNKGELITAIAAKSGLSKAASEKALNSMISAITGSLKKGNRVGLVGFGSFSVSKRAARKGRNPQTGKEITIAAKKVVKFKPGADLAL
jgi:DNA-binding protein HU-beta